jgi:L-idonate 5-dehydrogenase
LDLKNAALAEPTAVALHAINMSSGVTGKKILVTGSGPIGLLLIAVAKIKGAAHITSTDLLNGPLERAKLMGADETINVSTQAIPESSYDIVFECSGVAPAISSAIVSAKKRGEIIQVGMLGAGPQQIAIAPLISKEISLRGTFRFIDEIDEAIELIAAHPIFANSLTHTFDLPDLIEAFTVAKNSEISGKVLVRLGDFNE